MLRLIALICLFAIASLSLADGCSFSLPRYIPSFSLPTNTGPERVEQKPNIPAQRAVLKHENGIETMIVESTISGPKGDYGWIVPVPSKPLFVKAVVPEYIQHGFRQAVPRVVRDTPASYILALVGVLAATYMLTVPFRYKNHTKDSRVMIFIIEVIALCLCGTCIFPVFAQVKDSSSIADQQSYGTVGSYQIEAIQDKDGAKVLQWLSKNGFYVSEDSKKAIVTYAKENWWFLASKFRKDTTDALPPHPLKVAFKSPELIYPMRLTASQNTSVFVELLVVGNSSARVKELKTRRSRPRPIDVFVDDEERDGYGEWTGNTYAMVKKGQVWSYLSGIVKPEQMQKDFKVEWTPDTYYSEDRAYPRSVAIEQIFLITLSILPLPCAVIGILLALAEHRLGIKIAIGAIVALSISLGIGLRWYLSVPKVETTEVSREAYLEQLDRDSAARSEVIRWNRQR